MLISMCGEVLHNKLEIDLGNVDNDAARWWTVILATVLVKVEEQRSSEIAMNIGRYSLFAL
jgi:hypothetical protein